MRCLPFPSIVVVVHHTHLSSRLSFALQFFFQFDQQKQLDQWLAALRKIIRAAEPSNASITSYDLDLLAAAPTATSVAKELLPAAPARTLPAAPPPVEPSSALPEPSPLPPDGWSQTVSRWTR